MKTPVTPVGLTQYDHLPPGGSRQAGVGVPWAAPGAPYGSPTAAARFHAAAGQGARPSGGGAVSPHMRSDGTMTIRYRMAHRRYSRHTVWTLRRRLADFLSTQGGSGRHDKLKGWYQQ